MDYSRYTTLAISRRGPNNSVLDIQMKARNGKLPTAGQDGHAELVEIWRDVGDDNTVRCAVLRGGGLGFSGGGDLALVQEMSDDFEGQQPGLEGSARWTRPTRGPTSWRRSSWALPGRT